MQPTVGVYTEPCHVGHFRAFMQAMHINRFCANERRGIQTVGRFSETYALQIEITVLVGLHYLDLNINKQHKA